MKKLTGIIGVCVMLLTLSFAGAAGAASYTFEPASSDLWDLDHYYAYEWGIEWDVPEDETIVGASLHFEDIRNWDDQSNVLFVHLLDSDFSGVHTTYDGQAGEVDLFDGQGDLLNVWYDLPETPQDITYEFDASEVAALTSFATDGFFGLGFDPDCHFWNEGVSLTIVTSTSVVPEVPEPGTMLLMGFGLLGLIGLGRKRFTK